MHSADRSYLVSLLPTRVRRNYRGGLLLDRLEQVAAPADSDRPESWLCSTTPARNPGMPPIAGEGSTRARGPDGRERTLPELFSSAPEFYLGAAHAARLGPNPGFIAKLLDSAMRLHVQAHPTSAFARERLNSPFGKLEVYYVLELRGGQGDVRLGFQRSPGRDEWRRIIARQDIRAMEACFDPISVQPGEVWIVPGGMPHAIGAGVLMVEVMEPSDWVVRCEFEREGVVLPPDGRFMGRGLEFCLEVFDYTSYPVDEIRRRCRLRPENIAGGLGWSLDALVGADRTSRFEIQRVRTAATCTLPRAGRPALVIQTRGAGTVSVGPERLSLHRGEAGWIAAAAASVTFSAAARDSEWLLCQPAPIAP